MPNRLIHCIYASAAAQSFTTPQLLQLLVGARERNAHFGITGVLLHAEGSFFQVLEGPVNVIDPLFARIEQDRRHEQVTQIIREPIARRMFADWSMGFHDITRADLNGMAGLNDFFTTRTAVTAIDAGRARKLLAGFCNGRWRKKSRVPELQAAAA